MSNLNDFGKPGVYIQDAPAPAIPMNDGLTNFVDGFAGMLRRGKDRGYVISWTDFLNQFNFGLETPFSADMDLAYAVYGYFSNGGNMLHIARVVPTGAKIAASATEFAQTEDALTAADAGAWGNTITLAITNNVEDPTTYDAAISVGSTANIVEQFIGMTLAPGNDFFLDILAGSNIIKLSPLIDRTVTFVEADIKNTFTFTGGDDGVASATDADFVNALHKFDDIPDINIVAIPGQTSTTVRQGILDYVKGRGDVFAIIDPPQNSTIASILSLRKTMDSLQGAMYFPWLSVPDPLTGYGGVRNCPPSGHIAGIYSRTVQKYGLKSPAGTRTNLVNVTALTYEVTDAEAGQLNTAGINCMLKQPGTGELLVWGARSLANTKAQRYVTDGLVYCVVKKNLYFLGLPFIFERNNPTTQNTIISVFSGFMDRLWSEEILKGIYRHNAYYVLIDPSMNTETSIDGGVLVVEVGYAANKPLEFLVVKISQQLARG